MASARQILAIARIPSRPDAMKVVASLSGHAPADVRMRLGGTLPRVLLSHADAAQVARIAAELEKAGFVTIACDPADAPTDAQRIVARQLELEAGSFTVIERNGVRHAVAPETITLFQRGWRTSISTEEVTTKERRVSLGRAVLTGGLLTTKKVTSSSVEVTESREAILVVHRVGGQPEIIFYERQLDYRFLGAELQPAAFANFTRTTQLIRALAPRVPLDETVGQSGYVQRLAGVAAGDPLDLALYLIARARAAAADVGGQGTPQA